MTTIYLGKIRPAFRKHILQLKISTRSAVLMMAASLGDDKALGRITYAGPKLPDFSELAISRRLDEFDIENGIDFDGAAILQELESHLWAEADDWLEGQDQESIDEMLKNAMENKAHG